MFEKFWKSYPQAINKESALYEFKQINPDNKLFEKIMQSLELQIKDYNYRVSRRAWVPKWKYPANWLANESWNDYLTYENEVLLKQMEEQERIKKIEMEDDCLFE